MHPPLELNLGPFRLQAPIGLGGSGVVWRGVHEQRDVPVAVKVLTSRASCDGAFHAAFRNEVEAVASLSHRGVVLVFDYGTITREEAVASGGQLPEGQPYLAMELASLGSLDRNPPTSWHETQRTLSAMLDALAHAHARGVVHRDIKPSNVLLAAKSDLRPGIKISDFGIASVASRSAPRRISGTPPYMAPEQFRGDQRDVGPWTDLYALGCMAWEWVTGVAPFGIGRPMQLAHRHLYEEPPPLDPRFPVPAGLESWLRRLLEKSAHHRFRLAADAAWSLFQLGPVDPDTPFHDRPTKTDLEVALTVDTLDNLLAERLKDPESTLDDIVIKLDKRPEPTSSLVPPLPLVTPEFPDRWEGDLAPRTDLRVLQATLNLYGLRTISLVGRNAERDRLWAALQQVHRFGGVRSVVLQGQAGVGTSALARWLTVRAHELGTAHTLTAHHGRLGGPGQGLGPMFARHLGIEGLLGDHALDRVTRYLRHRGERDPSEILALTQLLASEDHQGVLPSHTTSARERYALYTRLLGVIAWDRPVILWLDDVQWNAEALDFTNWLASSPQSPAVLVVLTVQNEALAEAVEPVEHLNKLQAHPHNRTIRVKPLREPEARVLVQRLLRLDTDLSETVVQRTGGNPLFTVQLLGDWVQRDVLRPSARGLALAPDATAPLPDDLYDVWSTRVTRALSDQSADARLALELAAALGDSIDMEEWHECCHIAGITPPFGLVGRLVRSRLALPTGSGWRFAHGMLRETIERAARETGRWPEHNGAAAEMLLHRRGTPGRIARRGRHLLEAQRPNQAISALLEAARRRMQKDEALRSHDLLALAGMALEQADAAPSDGRWGAWRLLSGRVLKARQELDDAWQTATGVETDAQLFGWGRLEAEALADQADIARMRGDLPAALHLSRRALTRYRDLDDLQGLADTLRNLSSVAIQLGAAHVGEKLLTDARRCYDDLGDRFGAAMCLAGLGDIARVRQNWEEATNWFRSSLSILRSLGHRSGVALGLHGLAEVQRLTGNLEAARDGYLQVIQLDDALGRDNSIARLNLALCEISRGQFDAALDTLVELQSIWVQRGRPGYLAIVHVAQLPCAAAKGRWDDFRAHLQDAVRLLEDCAIVDLDVANLAEHAGLLAAEAGRHREATDAWNLSASQWAALNAEHKVAELHIALEHLPFPGT